MRILKYILLLALLAVIGLSVYVATQDSAYKVERSKVINAQKSVVFSYVNDYKNWEDFGAWKEEDPNMVFTYGDTTIGNGASYSWKGDSGEGKTITIFEKENDSIAQNVTFSGNEAKSYLTFKDTAGGTKVTWHSEGNLGFMAKVYATFKGGASQMIGKMFEKTLDKLEKIIAYEMNTYDIKINGVVQKSGGYYFQQKITCKISESQRNINIILTNMLRFFEENNIKRTGSPFAIYSNYDLASNLTTLSVCLPMQDEIFTAEGSDYTSGKLEPFQAVKTTLKGDYSHSKEAWDKTVEYIKKNNLAPNAGGKHLEFYTIGSSEVKNPSKWITEIFVPIGSAIVTETEALPEVPAEVVKPKPITKPITKSAEKKPESKKSETKETDEFDF